MSGGTWYNVTAGTVSLPYGILHQGGQVLIGRNTVCVLAIKLKLCVLYCVPDTGLTKHKVL